MTAWLETNRDVEQLDIAFMERRVEECRDVPELSFMTREGILRPYADAGDPHAQYLLATSFPEGTPAYTRWLREAVSNGHGPAMVLLARELAPPQADPSGMIEAWRLLQRAMTLGVPDVELQLEALEERMDPELIGRAVDGL